MKEVVLRVVDVDVVLGGGFHVFSMRKSISFNSKNIVRLVDKPWNMWNMWNVPLFPTKNMNHGKSHSLSGKTRACPATQVDLNKLLMWSGFNDGTLNHFDWFGISFYPIPL